MVGTALGGLTALAAAIGVGRFVYTPIVPAMIEALGLSKSAAGMIASANFLGYLLGALLAACSILPGSRRAWLLGALVISALTTAGMGLVVTVPLFVVLRLIGGAASAVVLVLASTLVLEHLAHARRPGLAALHFAGVGCGIAISAALVAMLLRAGQSWQSLWLANGIPSLIAAVAVALLMKGEAPAASQANHTRSAMPPALLRLVIAYGLFGFGYVITATFIVAMVRATPELHAVEPVVWIAFGLAAVPSVAVWSHVASRCGTSRAFAIACCIEAFGVAASIVWPTAIGILTASILVGGTFMGLTALGLVHARMLASGDPRRVLALMTCAFGLGQIIGPSFAGLLSDRFGGFAVPSATAAITLLIAAGLVLIPESVADSRVAPRSAGG